MAKDTYKVVRPLKHNGKDYAPGAPVELNVEEAKLLIDSGAVQTADGSDFKAKSTRMVDQDTLVALVAERDDLQAKQYEVETGLQKLEKAMKDSEKEIAALKKENAELKKENTELKKKGSK